MISDRYATKIARHWSPEERIQTWLKIELLNLKAYSQEHYEKASKAFKDMSNKYIADQSRLIEDKIGHEVEAFVQFLNRVYPTGLWHKGLASSDLVECSNAVAMNKALLEITDEKYLLTNGLRSLMVTYKDAPAHGYTHGQKAEPITWGLRFFVWAEQLEYFPMVSVRGKMTGAVGTGIVTAPGLVRAVVNELHIDMSAAATQIVPRHQLCGTLDQISGLAMALEKISNDMRMLYTLDQLHIDNMPIGSSSMPHKVNPYELERLIGMCKMIMSMVDCINRTNADGWLERDLVHSSVEREFLPVICNHTYYVVNRLSVILGRSRFRLATPDDLISQWSSVKLADMLTHETDRKAAREAAKSVTIEESVEYLSRMKIAVDKILG